MRICPQCLCKNRPPGAVKRLTKTSDYRRVYCKGSILSSPLLKLYLLRQGTSYARLGVVVSKRVSTKATVRNRIKRAIKQWFQQQAPAVLRSHYDIVVIAKKPVGTALYTSASLTLDLEGLISKCTKQANIYAQP
jgi:ribonuclease P protein component